MGLIVASLLPLSHGSELFSAQRAFLEESVARRATVVGLVSAEPGAPNANSVDVYSVVEFTDDEGSRRAERTNVGSYPAAHFPGEEIDIRFHRSKKNDVRIDSFTGMWFESAFYLIPGVVTFLAGVAMVLSGRKRKS